MNWDRTLSLIPDGVQTMSKMPNKYVDGVYPKYISHGKGSKVYSDGKEFIDYTCGLGAIVLGHANEDVNQAVFSQARKGTLFGLPHESETLLAEKLVEHFPMDKVRFVKTGSEATSAAVKIARAYTNKETILCCGYHGWHEWYNQTTPKNKGCSKSKVYPFNYNDIASLRALFRRHKDVAAVIMEPYVYDAPKENFLDEVRRTCDQNKALLIFDEVVTGFRTNKWCAANEFRVKPDLMCIGKAMGNGYPIGAVGGSAKIMDVLKHKDRTYKVIFVICMNAGRIDPVDITLINNFCGIIGVEYSVIINRVSKKLMDFDSRTMITKFTDKNPTNILHLEMNFNVFDEDNVMLENGDIIKEFINAQKSFPIVTSNIGK